jgi:hypothetical protein
LDLRRLKKMDLENEIISLSAPTHALNMLLINIQLRMTSDSRLQKMIEDGLEQVANDAEQVAIAMGHDAHPDQTVREAVVADRPPAIIARVKPFKSC